jgi:WD40 repeat protein
VHQSQQAPVTAHVIVTRRAALVRQQVWSLADCRKLATLRGHERSILNLLVHQSRLFSSAGCTVKVWNLETYECETSLNWGPARAGEILSLAACGSWLYAGFRVRAHPARSQTALCATSV